MRLHIYEHIYWGKQQVQITAVFNIIIQLNWVEQIYYKINIIMLTIVSIGQINGVVQTDSVTRKINTRSSSCDSDEPASMT